jgi:hypothetical protein
MLTIAYFTNRKNPRLQWFFDSLHRETGGNYRGQRAQGTERIRVVVVDFYAYTAIAQEHRPYQINGDRMKEGGGELWVTQPKPTVWQGQHKLTSVDYFCPSNARNTAIALAPDGYIAFVDDLSVLLPGWLSAVREAEAGGYIALGAYKKQLKMVVEGGDIKSFDPYSNGVDSRWSAGADHPVPAAGSWMFGCSLAAPVQAFLDINGFDEDCDSMGGEDYLAGMMLERAGYRLMYDRRMLTYESEEAHHEDPPFKRIIKIHRGAHPGCKDASHAILQQVQGGRNRAPNYFGPEGLAGLRRRALAGEPFPICQIPQHDWRDSQPLAEM